MAAVGAVVLGCARPAAAETYSAPGISVGTNGSDAEYKYVSVSQGGCASGDVAIAIGESNRDCYGWGYNFGSDEARGNYLGVGALGADSGRGGLVSVSDTGDARGCVGCNVWLLLGYECVSVGASATGTAVGCYLAASGTGNATGWHNGSAVAPLGDASASRGDNGAGAAVSGIGNASGWAAVSGTGSASGGLIAIAGGDASAYGGLVAVSATGDACGGSVYSLAPMGQAC